MMESCGSEYGVIGHDLHLVAADVDQLGSFESAAGPTQRKRSLENLLSDRKYLPSSALVSPMEVKPWPSCCARPPVKHDLGVLVALEGLDCRFDVPLHDLAVEEQGGEGVALVVEAGVQGAEADFGFGDDASRGFLPARR